MYKNKKVFLCIVFISVAVCLCYANIFNAPFIFDDVFLMDEIQQKSWWQLLLPSAGFRPFYKLTFALNYYWTGENTWSYHLVNIFIHALNSILIFAIVAATIQLPLLKKKLRKNAVYFAVAIAGIWAVHPLNSQAVTYLSQRCEIMMTLFYLSSWWCFIKSDRSEKTVLWQIAGLLAFVLGLGSKEAMVSAPLVILLYDRVFLSSSFKVAVKKHAVFYSGIIAVFLIPAIYLLTVGKFSHYWAYLLGRHGVDPWQYLMSQSEVVLHYIKLSFMPWGLCFDYDWQLPVGIESVIPALAFWVLFFVLLINLSRKNMILAFPVWFFILNLLPRSLVSSTHAAVEYRMYLPLAGLIVFYIVSGNWLIRRFADRDKQLKRACQALIPCCVAIAFITGTILRNQQYVNPLELWRDNTLKAPHNFRAWNYYGIALSEIKELEKAGDCFHRALYIMPGNFMALNNLANTYMEMGAYDKAVPLYYESLKTKNERKEIIRRLNSTTHQNLGKIFVQKKDYPKAVFHYTEAIRLNPESAALKYELGAIFLQLNERKVAEQYFKDALKLDEKFYFAYNDLGLIAVSEGRNEEAEKLFRQAVSFNSEYIPARINLGLVLEKLGKQEEAVQQIKKAISSQPNNMELQGLLERFKQNMQKP